jgi:hypothetical protein
VAPDPVNQPMIRHWAAAFEDRNPVSTDPEVASHWSTEQGEHLSGTATLDVPLHGLPSSLT